MLPHTARSLGMNEGLDELVQGAAPIVSKSETTLNDIKLNDTEQASASATPELTPTKPMLYADWALWRDKAALFDTLTKFGDKLTIVMHKAAKKHGLAHAIRAYRRNTHKVIRINYMHAHLAEVEFIGFS